ncbi:hypothetical protein H310_13128 [Aphanomyces invadans]|uniref:Uncharacterized protein n=1 Tax=Aphanomyces invadans TaxID=157072 RepID=A0A024TGG8_9STRA|nr:hypothetical protein H310_13128 [Aphanomyces invadans]ETV92691.1 hypothetical protein H310_13128 [Aphanomyces invadans]|eukprot:XP_008878727.1 hypothetical protein H310_13128 [Aphanomyces invadans]
MLSTKHEEHAREMSHYDRHESSQRVNCCGLTAPDTLYKASALEFASRTITYSDSGCRRRLEAHGWHSPQHEAAPSPAIIVAVASPTTVQRVTLANYMLNIINIIL